MSVKSDEDLSNNLGALIDNNNFFFETSHRNIITKLQ